MSAVSVSMLRYAGCIPVHLSRRWYSSKLVSSVSNASNRRMMITTPIYYVNSSPHIGHLHSSVLADALARWYNMKKGPNSIDALLTTGTDEHGLKVRDITSETKRFADAFSKSGTASSRKSQCCRLRQLLRCNIQSIPRALFACEYGLHRVCSNQR